ncbi:MAG: glycerate kinase [Actinoallomurus sp.]
MPASTDPPRVLLAPDSFKGGLSAHEVAHELSTGLRAVDPETRLLTLPLADGGEGTIEVLASIGATVHRTVVAGPLGGSVHARWAELDAVAYIEMAQAAGHGLVSRRDASTALAASTRGVGELIVAALDADCRRLVLTVGGSATTDGGAGMLQALGGRLLSEKGRSVPPGGGGLLDIDHVDLSLLDPRLRHVPMTVACDVENPLLGPKGAATVFAPQKGAGPDEVLLLERALRRWTVALDAVAPVAHAADLAGAGASGGIGFAAMAALSATRVSGAAMMLDLLGVDGALKTVDITVTGEGSFDHQTHYGKAPGVLLQWAQAQGAPVAVVAGSVALGSAELRSMGVCAAWSLVDMAGSQKVAMDRARELLRQCGSEVLLWWRGRDSR